MDWNDVQQILRIIMQVVAGFLMSKGYLNEEMATTLTGAVVSIGAVVWWFVWNRKASTPAEPSA
jgi:hypothetical protein